MNILIFSTNAHYWNKPASGAEISLRLIAEKFAEINEKVYYATIDTGRIPGIRKEFINGVNVYALRPFRWPDLNGKLFPKAKNSIKTYQLKRFLAGIIRRKKINVVYTFDTFPDTYNVLRLRNQFQLDFKIVQRIGGLRFYHQIEDNMVSQEKVEWVFNNIDIINFVSSEIRELFYLYARKQYLTVIPKRELIMDIGINLGLFHGEWKPHKRTMFKIVCAARLDHVSKRQDLLIEAIDNLRNKDIRVEFAGFGLMLEPYKKRVRKLGLEGQVIFHGFLSQKNLLEILVKADLFALPTDYEGVPKAMLEAMAIGLPCLVSDVQALNSYVEEGKNGYLCSNTPEKWADKIGMIYREKEEMINLSSRAKEFVFENYNADKNILKYKEGFEV